jgi:hypothetical protein
LYRRQLTRLNCGVTRPQGYPTSITLNAKRWERGIGGEFTHLPPGSSDSQLSHRFTQPSPGVCATQPTSYVYARVRGALVGNHQRWARTACTRIARYIENESVYRSTTRAVTDAVGVWQGQLVGRHGYIAKCCHRQLWQCQGAYEVAIRFSKPAPTRFPSFPTSLMASSCSTRCCCSSASRKWGVAVSALFSVILISWRWLFTLLGGG